MCLKSTSHAALQWQRLFRKYSYLSALLTRPPKPESPETFSLGGGPYLTFLLYFLFSLRDLYNTSSTVLDTLGILKLNSRDTHNDCGITAPETYCTLLLYSYTLQTEGKPKYAGSFVNRRHSQSCLRRGTQNAHGHHAYLIWRHPTSPSTKSGQRPPHFRSLT